MIHKKTLAVGIVGTLLGIGMVVGGIRYSNKLPEPKDLARVYELERRLGDKNIALRDLLIPYQRNLLEDEAQKLGAERDSLEALPTFELTEENYELKEKIRKAKHDNLYFGGLSIVVFSMLYPTYKGFGLYDKLKKT